MTNHKEEVPEHICPIDSSGLCDDCSCHKSLPEEKPIAEEWLDKKAERLSVLVDFQALIRSLLKEERELVLREIREGMPERPIFFRERNGFGQASFAEGFDLVRTEVLSLLEKLSKVIRDDYECTKSRK